MNVLAYAFTDPTGFRRVGAVLSDEEAREILGQYPEVHDLELRTITQEEFDAWRDSQAARRSVG